MVFGNFAIFDEKVDSIYPKILGVIQEQDGEVEENSIQHRGPIEQRRYTKDERSKSISQRGKYLNVSNVGRLREKYTDPSRFEDDIDTTATNAVDNTPHEKNSRRKNVNFAPIR